MEMKNTKKALLLFIKQLTVSICLLPVLLFGGIGSAYAAWEKVGTAGFSEGYAEYTSLAFDGSTPYVAYRNEGNGGKATVMRFNGTGTVGTWETVGTAGFSEGEVWYTSLAFNGSTPYVAYQDKGNGNKATVMRFNGTGTVGTWETVGDAGFSAGETDYTSLAFDGSTPYVAYTDGKDGYKATVMRFNGTGTVGTWETVGTAGFSEGEVWYTSLAFDGSTPYVAYRDWGNGGKATVMRFNGTGTVGTWETVGDAGFSAGETDYTSLAFDGSTPYVAYRDKGNESKATVMRFNGTGTVGTWETVGNAGFSAGEVNFMNLAFTGSTPYVAYRDWGNGGKATVMRFNGTGTVGTWETVGTAGFSEGNTEYTSLAFTGSTPYVAYADGRDGYKATVMRYNLVTTDPATEVTPTTATLNGRVNANNATTDVFFQYGTDTTYGSMVEADQSPVTGSTDNAVSKAITGLTNGVTYHYRVVGTYRGPLWCGADMTFITTGAAPAATTNAATGVTTTGATMNGTVNANNDSTTVTFEYGTTTAYGTTVTATQSPVTGTADTAVSKMVSNLTPSTTYHYRVVGQNSTGTTYGADMTFITNGTAPAATTNAATGVTTTGATMNGTVNANNAGTTVSFEYGTTTAYGTTVTATQSPVTGTADTAVSKMVSNLTPSTTYHYRVVGQNSTGTTYGADMTFITNGTAPAATTNAATGVTTTGATMNGTVNANNAGTTVSFEYGTTTAYGTTVTATQSPVTGTADTAVSKTIIGLTPSTTYHYRVVGQNPTGTTNGADMTFITPEQTPTIMGINPETGGPGTDVVITGTGFTAATVNSDRASAGISVKFGGTDAERISVDSATRITATVGQGSTGKVTVTTAAGTATSAVTFTFISAIPTLNEWALILLSILLLVSGVIVLRKRSLLQGD